MQFREQGRRIQVLAYRGYNKEKKRAEVKLLGSFDRYGFQLSDGLMDSLSPDEKTELLSHIETMRQSDNDSHLQYQLKSLDTHIMKICDSLSGGKFDSLVTDEYASKVYASIDSLTKLLRKKGFRRPAQQKGDGAGDLHGKMQQ